jgi:hypothetical protein
LTVQAGLQRRLEHLAGPRAGHFEARRLFGSALGFLARCFHPAHQLVALFVEFCANVALQSISDIITIAKNLFVFIIVSPLICGVIHSRLKNPHEKRIDTK